MSAFIGACILRESPLQPIQLLWVNLIMDSLGSLALATEPPQDKLLQRAPQSRDEYIISRKMVKHLIAMSIWQCIVIFTLVFAGEYFLPEVDYRTCPEIPQAAPNGEGIIFPGRLYNWNGSELYLAQQT